MTKVSILGLASRIGKDYGNTAILKAALELLPENMELEILDAEIIPQPGQDVKRKYAGGGNLHAATEKFTPAPEKGTTDYRASHPSGARVLFKLHHVDRPQETIAVADEKTDGGGKFTDEKARVLIQGLLAGLESGSNGSMRK